MKNLCDIIKREKSRILVLTPTFPYPPRSGGDIRIFELIKSLASRYEVHLLSYNQGDHDGLRRAAGIEASHGFERVEPSGLVSRIKRKLNFWKGSPHGLSLSVDPAYARRVYGLIRDTECDAVLIEYLYMFQYAEFCAKTSLFFSAPNVETIKYQRWYEGQALDFTQRWRCRFQERAIRRLESRVGSKACAVFATSDSDRDELRKMNKKGRFVTVPNGADLEYFTARTPGTFFGPPSVLFIGSLFYKPNADAVLLLVNKVMPRLRMRFPGCECHIVGNTAGGDFSSLHQPESKVFFHGCVPDIRPYLQCSQVLAVPLLVGSGTRIKILEAMAAGTPVVSSRIGAEGIGYTAGVDILLADTPSEMAEAVGGLLGNSQAAYQMGQAGRRLVEAKYTWTQSAAIMRTEMDAVLTGRNSDIQEPGIMGRAG